MEKLKRTGKYEEYKQKKAVNRKKLRESKKEEDSKLSPTQLVQITESRRAAIRNRVQKHRQNLKERKLAENVDPNSTDPAYRCANTLGKAAKRLERNLPSQKDRRTAVIAKVIEGLDEGERLKIVNSITKDKEMNKNHKYNELAVDIRGFFERDDISRMSPKSRDVKEYINPETGEKSFEPMKHMILTMREAFAVFVAEREQSGKGNANCELILECHSVCRMSYKYKCHSIFFQKYVVLLYFKNIGQNTSSQ